MVGPPGNLYLQVPDHCQIIGTFDGIDPTNDGLPHLPPKQSLQSQTAGNGIGVGDYRDTENIICGHGFQKALITAFLGSGRGWGTRDIENEKGAELYSVHHQDAVLTPYHWICKIDAIDRHGNPQNKG